MNHVPKRLVSTAARLPSVAPSALSVFPPKEAFKLPKDAFVKDEFNPDNWAALQPAPSTALVAFANRIGLAALFSSPDLVRQACTHPSFLPLFRKHYPSKPEPPTNAQLATLGNSLMGLFAAEYVQAKYPYLPTRVLKAAVTAHVGPSHATPATDASPGILHADALASIPRSLTGLIYKSRSLRLAREFVHSYFLSREIDIRGMLKFYNPKKSLMEMVQKYQREPPKSRLLKETGRFSNTPVFVVGIYSGADKLGEGFGASLRMAEYRVYLIFFPQSPLKCSSDTSFQAAEDALHRVYLTQTPDDMLQLPSSTFPSVKGNVYKPGPEGSYTAPELVPADVLYASSDRSGFRRS
ncbi:60S ribosomal protein L3 [Gymnopilus junonius]|uniref:Large ribosomal subunit protein mL44 n=1 Tax=Gymnopilus junonius TaxID=109634 RepID=A0A9P5TRI2_GYMJU|nr:60S ribosomal protein L3 [Gymnopilus junonius]